MNHYIHLEPTVKLSLDVILTNVYSLLLFKLIYGNKLVKYLHWGINKSTYESFCTSFPTPSKISQLECLFTISDDKRCQFDRSGRDFEGRVTLICGINI